VTFHPLPPLPAAATTAVQPSGDTTGATDSARILAALTGFPRKYALLGPGIFYLSVPLLPQNNTWLQGSGYSTTTIQQGSLFAGSQMIGPLPGGVTISDLTLAAPSTSTSTNVQADGISITQNGVFISDIGLYRVRFQNLNGWCVNFTDDGTHGAPVRCRFETLIDGGNTAGGMQVIGASRTIGFMLDDFHLNANGGTVTTMDGLLLQDVFDMEMSRVYASAGGTSTGYGIHFKGHNNNARVVLGELGSGTSTVLIEDSGGGHASNITFSDITFQTASGANVDLEGSCTDIQFNNCIFNTATTHGAVVNTTGNKIKFRGCTWASDGTSTNNGHGASGTNYDLNWSGSGTGEVVACEFASSIVAVSSIGVQQSVNITASQAVTFDGARFTGASASSSNWFTATPAAVKVIGSTFNFAAGLCAPSVGFAPANPASTTSVTLVMMGLGSTCVFTPSGTGKVLVNVSGWYLTQTATVNATIGGRFGTGTAPVNGAAVSGTRFGPIGDPAGHAVNTANPGGFAITALLSLTAGTAYWFDIALATSAGADAAVLSNIAMTIAELPT